MPKRKFQRQIPTPVIAEKPFPQFPFQPEPIPISKRQVANELEDAILPMFPVPKRIRITPTLTQEIKNRGYKNFELDLSTARTNKALGLRGMGIIADTMTILRADDDFTYRINSAGNDETPGEKGLQEDLFEIEELYLTNSAGSGKAIIRVTWNPHLIRPR